MAYQFKNKVVYIISPQKWGVMKVSKHHYALELAERGNKVFFIEPPDLKLKGVSVSESIEHPLIRIVKYRPFFRGKQIIPSFVYNFLVKIQIQKFISTIKEKPDLVWSFSGHLFEYLRWSKNTKTIFFAADLYPQASPPPEVYDADVVIGVSDTICDKLKKGKINVNFINHGIHKAFVKIAKRRILELSEYSPVDKNLKIGYFGNLLMQALDTETMQRVIISNPHINFIFWGEYRRQNSNLGENTHEEASKFIAFLEKQPNVTLRGAIHPEKLAEEILDIDCFWICWKTRHHDIWDGSNSHKILEYMSTGKPIISHYMSTYANSDLLYMLNTPDNNSYPELFRETIEIILKGEDKKKVLTRIRTALDNTYSLQLDRISQFL